MQYSAAPAIGKPLGPVLAKNRQADSEKPTRASNHRVRLRPSLTPWLLLMAVFGVAAGPFAAQAQPGSGAYPPKIAGADEYVYKTIGAVTLKLWVFRPPTTAPAAPAAGRPAVVFFFGGGWRSGTPNQFVSHCEHFAERGMIAAVADYRVSSRHQTKVIDCVGDAQDAVAWLAGNAGKLGIDPAKIVAAGGSAGGHLAACTALLPRPASATQPGPTVRPAALVLFNPAVVLAPIDGIPDALGGDIRPARLAELEQRAGAPPTAISPYHHIAAGAPPTLILHGKADSTVPYRTVELFAKRMAEVNAQCQLAGYDGQPHGFFNVGRDGGKYYRETLARMDQFLVDQGMLPKR